VTVADLPTVEFLSGMLDTLAGGTVDLPAFPQVVIKVQEAFKDPNYTPQKIARVIATERSLADRLLQMANSTAFNATGKVIIDLGVAINRLGAQKVYSVALGHAVAHMRQNDHCDPSPRGWMSFGPNASRSLILPRQWPSAVRPRYPAPLRRDCCTVSDASTSWCRLRSRKLRSRKFH
jgi:hypothetical protein